MKKWIGALLNFFLPGLGNIFTGYKRGLGFGWLIAALCLTYVEFGIKVPLPELYWIMFAAVFLLNTMFAIDVYKGVAHEQPR